MIFAKSASMSCLFIGSRRLMRGAVIVPCLFCREYGIEVQDAALDENIHRSACFTVSNAGYEVGTGFRSNRCV